MMLWNVMQIDYKCYKAQKCNTNRPEMRQMLKTLKFYQNRIIRKSAASIKSTRAIFKKKKNFFCIQPIQARVPHFPALRLKSSHGSAMN